MARESGVRVGYNAGACEPSIERRNAVSSELTVVVPVWGAGRMECVRIVLQSILCQSVAPEVVLAETGPESLWGDYAHSIGIRHVHVPLHQHATGKRYSPGGIRNAGLLLVDTPWTLINDADVLLPTATHIERMLDAVDSGGESFGMLGAMSNMHPDGVARLVESDSWTPLTEPLPDTPVVDFRDGGLLPAEDEPVGAPPALSGLAEPDRPPGAPPYRGRSSVGRLGMLSLHCGGLLVPTELLKRLGGYCAQYVGYGFEDNDVLWKLQAHARPVALHKRIPDVYDIHLSHDRSGYSRINFERNELLFHIRCEEGVEAAVKTDLAALALLTSSVEGA